MKNKLGKLIWPFLYLILVFFVCGSGCMIFHSYYYRSIFVDGESMSPTLKGGSAKSDYISYFGIIDPHTNAINEIVRYNVVTTYFPWDDNDYDQTTYEPGTLCKTKSTAYYKIKRVIGVPGDIIRIFDTNIYYLDKESKFYNMLYDKTEEEYYQIRAEYGANFDNDLNEAFGEPTSLPFERNFGKNISQKNINFVSLHKDENDSRLNEYWLLGDNWGNSTDCGSARKCVYQENLVGVLVAIEGTCKIETGKGNGANGDKTCENRKYFKPIFFR